MASSNTFFARPVYMSQSQHPPLQNHIGADRKPSGNTTASVSNRTNRKLPNPELIPNTKSGNRISHGRKLPHTESLGTGKPSETDHWQRKTSGNASQPSRSSRKLPDPEIFSNCVNVQSRVRKLSDLENMEPPPRPPPPRPSRAPKRQENIKNIVTASSKDTVGSSFASAKSSRAVYNHEQVNHMHGTPEPKPLTRTNVTQHDGIWQKSVEEKSGPNDVLSPPLKYITPQTTEEMFRNFNPLDNIDSTSDHSDSSADTMIMMTTEEEKINSEKINHSLKVYKQVQSKGDLETQIPEKQCVQNKKNRHIHFSDTNGYVDIQTLDKSIAMSSDHTDLSKVSLLHISTENGIESSPGSNKNGGIHGSPNAESPDDGYGTNSSSGTVSSPFSSSFNSVITDFEHARKVSAGSSKQPGLPNGAIRPNSVRESWAVKRKQRMIEAQDNSLQEQLRQLTIIEEEGGAAASSENARKLRENVNLLRRDIATHRDGKVGKMDHNAHIVVDNDNVSMNPSEFHRNTASNSDPPYVNVSQTEIARRNRQLYVIDGDNNTEAKNRSRTLPATFNVRPVPQTSSANEINIQPPRVPPHRNVTGTNPPYSSAGSIERIYDQVYEPRNTVNVRREPAVYQDNTRMAEFRPASLASDSDASLVLRGGSEQLRTLNGSGNIYVSSTGDEGFYSLNRSGSVSSFGPIAEQVDVTNGPQSPLESISGDILEKWSDLDRNYRNYCGFEDNYQKAVGEDSKVNYFQEKQLKNVYGHDNYYQPQNYGPTPGSRQDLREPVARQHKTVEQHPEGHGSRTSSMSAKSTTSTSSKSSKLFHILPNMFKQSHKKHNTDKLKGKSKAVPVETVVPSPVVQEQTSFEQTSFDLDQEPEYVNMSDLPQYSMANLELEANLKKGQFTSVDNLHKRPVFASSKDIQKLFSLQDQSFDSINHPGSQRHSFHAVPLSYRYVNREHSEQSDMRPRAQSTSATMRSQQGRDSIERRMAVLHRKKAQVNQIQQNVSASNSVGNLSTNSSNAPLRASRTRLDSGSSGGELSTLV